MPRASGSSSSAATRARPTARSSSGASSDDELVEHYRRADAFLDTSLYEGFGFQVLEAMACGTPVVASDTTSIPELVGDAALLCPPGDVDAFAAALRRLRTRTAWPTSFVAAGSRARPSSRGSARREQLADAVEEAART